MMIATLEQELKNPPFREVVTSSKNFFKTLRQPPEPFFGNKKDKVKLYGCRVG